MGSTRPPAHWRNMLGQEQAKIRDNIRRETASLRAGTHEAIARSNVLLAKTGGDGTWCAYREIC